MLCFRDLVYSTLKKSVKDAVLAGADTRSFLSST